MDDANENSGDQISLGTRLMEGFDARLAELEHIGAIVEPLKEPLLVFLRTQEVLKGTSLTMIEVIDFTVQSLKQQKDFVSLCLARDVTIHELISEIAGFLWLYYRMEDYDYLHIDDDPAFTCSGEIENALREKLEVVGLVGRPN